MEALHGLGAFHNSGGPRSRMRIEPIRSAYLENPGLDCLLHQERIQFQLPCPCPDIRGFLLKKFKREWGLTHWQDIYRAAPLPSEPFLVLPAPEIGKRDSAPFSLLHALILARCNAFSYRPQGDFIFTEQRLNRRIYLLKLNIPQFYALEP
jgi:hypothetical protein